MVILPVAALYFTDLVVVAVGDVNVAGRVNRDVGRGIQLGRGRRAAVAAGPYGAGAGYRADLADGCTYLANLRVTGVSDEDVSGGVDRDALGEDRARPRSPARRRRWSR